MVTLYHVPPCCAPTWCALWNYMGPSGVLQTNTRARRATGLLALYRQDERGSSATSSGPMTISTCITVFKCRPRYCVVSVTHACVRPPNQVPKLWTILFPLLHLQHCALVLLFASWSPGVTASDSISSKHRKERTHERKLPHLHCSRVLRTCPSFTILECVRSRQIPKEEFVSKIHCVPPGARSIWHWFDYY